VREEVDLHPATGGVEPRLAMEFPGLELQWLSVEARMRPSPPHLQRRLRSLADRYRGAGVVAMRTQAIPHAYRAFFRQIGLDPDVTRIPSEEAAVARLKHGGFRSRDTVHDALLVALVETGVPVWALDGDAVEAGGLGIRTTVAGERLGDGAHSVPLAPGRLVVADARKVHALLFGEIAAGHGAGAHTSRLVLFTVGVGGVPPIYLHEALWMSVEALQAE
jgi:DNA/RNA-binding domain of Phe-tRNA-synthetase-like protein